MFGLPFGVLVESGVAILLAMTIGYCVVLNERLKRLHADRDMLRQMVTDLVQATDLANAAVKELKSTAMEADLALNARLEEAERFGIELANHVAAGTSVMERIARITSAARTGLVTGIPDDDRMPAPPEPNRLQSALAQLAARPRIRGNAA
jgi:hypothetical protein